MKLYDLRRVFLFCSGLISIVLIELSFQLEVKKCTHTVATTTVVIDCSESNQTETDLNVAEIQLVSESDSITLLVQNKNYMSILSNGEMRFKTDKLKELGLKKNNIRTIEISAFQNLTGLKKLDLSQNRIKQLESGAFANLNELGNLDISSNMLEIITDRIMENITKLQAFNWEKNKTATIKKGSLDHSSKMICLNLNSNRISRINSGAFSRLKNLGEFYVRKNHIASVESISLHEIASLERLDLSYNKIENISSFTFQSNNKLRTLDLSNNLIKEIHINTFAVLDKLEKLVLSKNSIELIEIGSFDHLKKIKEIDLSFNKMIKVQHDLFRNLSELNSLLLESNYIATIEPGAFHSLSKLQSLHIFNNFMKDVSDRIFTELKCLRSLLLLINKITHLKADSFLSLINLQFLSLRSNKIKSIEFNTFRGLKNLIILDLENNELEFVDSGIIDEISRIYSISLNRNKITSLVVKKSFFNSFYMNKNKIRNLENITLKNLEANVLSFEDNLFEFLPKKMFNNLSVIHLIFSRNQVICIGRSTFRKIRKIEKLSMDHNRISDLNENQFKGLTTLKELDLSHNIIDYLDGSSFGFNMPNLEKLNLEGNRIRLINPFTFAKLACLYFLDLSDNQLIEELSINLAGLVNLTHLNLSSNRLKSFEIVSRNTAHLTRLKALNMSDNEIKRINYSTLTNSHFAVVLLDMSHNSLLFPLINSMSENITELYLQDVTANSTIEICEIIKPKMQTLDLSYNNAVDFTHLITNNSNKSYSVKSLFLKNTHFVNFTIKTFFTLFKECCKELVISDYHFNVSDLNLKSVTSLTVLKLINVSLASVDDLGHILTNKKVKHLDLSFNRLTSFTFDGSTTFNIDLKYLILNNNRIQTFKIENNCKDLIELDLRENELTDLDLFSENCKNPIYLQRLEFSQNRLTQFVSFPTGVIFFDLVSVNYSYNLICLIQVDSFPIISNLHLIDLQFNRIDDIEINALIVPSLFTLNLCHNRLVRIRKHYFEFLYGLETLNMSSNLIHTIEPKSFAKLSKLITLDLGNNSLLALNGADYANLTSLRFLFLDRMPQLKLEETSFKYIWNNIKDIHLDSSLFFNDSVVCLVNRTLTARPVNRRRFSDIIYLLIASDLYDGENIEKRQRFCDITYFYLLHRISFNIKSDYSFEYFFEKCQHLLRIVNWIRC